MINFYNPVIKKSDQKILFKTVKSGWISSQAGIVKEFEKKFAKWHSMKYAVATSNCTTALHLSLLDCDLKKNDEVICTNLTFIAPANMIHHVGAKLVLVDINPKTYAMDVKEIKKKISNKTKVIMVVHPFGYPADIVEIKKLAKKKNIKIIEDVAESIGAKINNKKLGTFGDLSCFSFFANKIMTTGEGGMILTNNKKSYMRLKLLRDHGMTIEKKYYHILLAFNYRMTSMQAALGIGQLNRLYSILKEKQNIKQYYMKYIANKYKIFSSDSNISGVNWFVTLTFEKNNIRNNFIKYMRRNGVDCRQMVFPISFAKHFRKSNLKTKFPNSTKISLNSVHLPSSNDLTENKIKKICKIINTWNEK